MSDPALVWSEPLSEAQANALINWGKAIQQAERERIMKLLQKAIAENGKDSWLDALELIKEN